MHFVGFLNKIPVIESLVTVIILVGLLYYFGVQRNKPASSPGTSSWAPTART